MRDLRCEITKIDFFRKLVAIQPLYPQSAKMVLSLSREELFDYFGERGVYSESPTTLFNAFELWSHSEGVFCYRLKPNSGGSLLADEYEERTRGDEEKAALFKNVQIHDPYEVLITPELYPEYYEGGEVHVIYTHCDRGTEHEALENYGSIPGSLWQDEHNNPGFRSVVQNYFSR